MRLRHLAWTLAGLGALALGCASLGGRRPAGPVAGAGGHIPVVFVSGVTGTQLRDPKSGELVWGGAWPLLRPRDGGRRLVLPLLGAAPDSRHPQADYEATAPLLQVRLPLFTKQIYRPLLARFEAAGYLYGELTAPRGEDDFFFFNYDWRYGNLESVRRLDRQLEVLSAARDGTDVDLVCQSNAAKICRWLAKYGTLDLDRAAAGEAFERSYRIRKIVLVGASNSGALRVLQLLNHGRSYIPLVGRKLRPETFFSLRPLFEDLPAARDDLFVNERGEKLAVDLFAAESWAKYGWSIFAKAAAARLQRDPRPDLFGDGQDQLDYLARQLGKARRLQQLLASDSAYFPAVRYYLLENASAPTIDRALLTEEGGEWRTYFVGDDRVDRDPALTALISAPGDGHAVLASQRGLSPQETAALVSTATAVGGHFEAVVESASLDAILGFLADPVTGSEGGVPFEPAVEDQKRPGLLVGGREDARAADDAATVEPAQGAI